MRTLYVLGMAYLAVSALALWRGPVRAPLMGGAHYAFAAPGSDGAAWFDQVKPFCNTLEVQTMHRQHPPPATLEGAGFGAACWALAGRIAEAREQIRSVSADDRWRAAGIVFEIGHPIADMGDDRSAGPIMELVVEFWPNHYQALYHAGAARFALGDWGAAERHLREFLVYYEQQDGWTASAKSMLGQLEAR